MNWMALATNQPINAALTTCLQLDVSRVSGTQNVGVANDGFWGIPVKPNTRYRASFCAKAGGNYLEGQTFATRFDWKKTIGDISERPGHFCDAWRYWSWDGMGLLEFLEWCEDLEVQPGWGLPPYSDTILKLRGS